MAGWSWRHLLCRNEPEYRSPYSGGQRRPRGDDRSQVRIRVHAWCTPQMRARLSSLRSGCGIVRLILQGLRRRVGHVRERSGV